MSEYTTPTGHNSLMVQVAEGNRVRYWCHSLDCTEVELQLAVQAVDDSPAKVRDFIKTLTLSGF